jgi:hypothetical protein
MKIRPVGDELLHWTDGEVHKQRERDRQTDGTDEAIFAFRLF